MHYCVKLIDLPAATAALAARPVYEFLRSDTPANFFTGRPCLSDCRPDENGKVLEVWHIFRKGGSILGGVGEDWSVQGIWRDRKTGNLHQHNPKIHDDARPWLPHFPCILLPTSELAMRTFRKCADYLIGQNDDGEASPE